jgi:hypothetical protein
LLGKALCLNRDGQKELSMNTNVNSVCANRGHGFAGHRFPFLRGPLVLIQSLIVRQRGRAKFVVLVMLLIAGAYLAAILIFSFSKS